MIQCAARKDPAATTFLTRDGRRVAFVARPDLAPPNASDIHARPDDPSGDGQSWRKRLHAYNEDATANPFGFLPAYQLYAHDAYGALVDAFGQEQVFILSAGWGPIPATFLTPYYDITFSASAEPWKRRRKEDHYEDFCVMRDDADKILFLGGKNYLSLFCRLTAGLRGHKTVFFNSGHLLICRRASRRCGISPAREPTGTTSARAVSPLATYEAFVNRRCGVGSLAWAL